jgi:hypothetical protein
MANRLALDIAYDAPVKFLAGQIFLESCSPLPRFLDRVDEIFVETLAINAVVIETTLYCLPGPARSNRRDHRRRR